MSSSFTIIKAKFIWVLHLYSIIVTAEQYKFEKIKKTINKIQEMNKNYKNKNNEVSKMKNQRTICLFRFEEVSHLSKIFKMIKILIMTFHNLTCFQILTIIPIQLIWWTVLLLIYHKILIKHLSIKDKVMSVSFWNNQPTNKKCLLMF